MGVAYGQTGYSGGSSAFAALGNGIVRNDNGAPVISAALLVDEAAGRVEAVGTTAAMFRLTTTARQAYINLANTSGLLTINPNSAAVGIEFGAGGSLGTWNSAAGLGVVTADATGAAALSLTNAGAEALTLRAYSASAAGTSFGIAHGQKAFVTSNPAGGLVVGAISGGLFLVANNAEVMRLAGGDVAIGTTIDSAYRLKVVKSGSATAFAFMASGGGGFSEVRVGSTTDTETARVAGGANDATGTLLGINKANGSFFYGGSSHTAVVLGGAHASSDVVFAPGGTEKGRFSSTGELAIGGAPVGGLRLLLSATAGGEMLRVIATDAAGQAQQVIRSGNARLAITSYGVSVGGTSFGVAKAVAMEIKNTTAFGNLLIGTGSATDVILGTNDVARIHMTAAGNIKIGTPSIAAAATDGFPYLPDAGATPTGTPSAITGMGPVALDSAGSKLWAYLGGAWKSVTFA